MDELLRALLMASMGKGRETNLYLSITDAETGEPVILLNSPFEGDGWYWAKDCGNPLCEDKEHCRRTALTRNLNYIKNRVELAEVVDRPQDVPAPAGTAPVEAGPISPAYFQVEAFINDLDDLFKGDGRD